MAALGPLARWLRFGVTFSDNQTLVCAVPLSVTVEHAQRAFRLAVALNFRQGALQFWLNSMLQCRVEFTPPSPSRWSGTECPWMDCNSLDKWAA